MYARIATAKIRPGKADELAIYMRKVITPNYKGLPGFRGATGLIDRQSDTALYIMYWDTKEASQQRPSHGDTIAELREEPSMAWYDVVVRD